MDAIDSQLQLAIAAARAGKEPQAKMLIERVLEAEPGNAHAWFLRSKLATSEEEQVESLNQVLSIDPAYPGAQEQLDELTGQVEAKPPPAEVAPAVEEVVVEPADDDLAAGLERLTASEATTGLEQQAEGDSVPDWLMEEGGYAGGYAGDPAVGSAEGSPAADAPTQTEELPTEATEIPQWLHKDPVDDWLAADVLVDEAVASSQVRDEPTAEPEPGTGAPAKQQKPAKRSADRSLEIILLILVILAVVVVVALVYVVITTVL